jgi:DNA-binding NarL/FixJ family response regulator
MIRVAVVDDHHAVRLGLHAAIRSEPGLVHTGVASNGAGVASMLERSRPDVILLDYHLPDADGLTLCRQIKSEPPAPGVILYSAFADAAMTVPALVAGADGIVHKGGPTRELFHAIRVVARGGEVLPPVSPPLLEAAGALLDPEDLPILGMLLDRIPTDEIAETLRVVGPELRARIDRMLRRLRVPVPAGAGSTSSPPARRQPQSRVSAAAATPGSLRAFEVRPASVEEDGLVLRMQRRAAQRAASRPDRDRPDAEEPEGCA